MTTEREIDPGTTGFAWGFKFDSRYQLAFPEADFSLTYSEFTVGVTYKPGLPGPIQTLMPRPELRYDRSLNGTTPFNDGRDSGAVTLAADVIIGF